MDSLKRICFSILLFPIVFLAVGLLFIFMGYSDCQDYKIAQDTTAIVTKCEYDVDYGTDDMPVHGYDIYISYTFEGNEYADVYWKSQSDSINLGTTVSVKVSPNIPEEPFSENPFSLLIWSIPFVLLGIVLSFKLIPASVSGKKDFVNRSQFPNKSKGGLWFVLIPVVASIAFFILGLNISPMFHIGTIIFAYFTIVFTEILSS